MKTTNIWPLLASIILLHSTDLYAKKIPYIKITNIPPFGAGGYLHGRAMCDQSNPCGVAVYIKVNEKWWTKPYTEMPLIPIQDDGSWGYDLNTYPTSDDYATKYVVYLVPLSQSNRVPALSNALALPPILDEISLARDVRIRTSLYFSGLEWEIKVALLEKFAPGTNWFGTNNVWLDGSGRLHLKIRKEIEDGTNKWSCGEVICADTFGCGLYRFYIDTNIGNLNSSVVFSPFTYSDFQEFDYREIDVEFTTWNNRVTNGNAQYTIHSPNGTDIIQRFVCPSNIDNSVHWFVWSPWRIDFSSLEGHDPASANPSDLITNWSFLVTPQIPPAGFVRPRINLYLSDSQPPTDTNEVEVIVSRFEYQPLLSFTSARQSTSNTMLFTIQNEVMGLIDIESSTNLADAGGWNKVWTNIEGMVGQPMQFEVFTTNAESFYRGKLHFP
jgi:hypothetical protein